MVRRSRHALIGAYPSRNTFMHRYLAFCLLLSLVLMMPPPMAPVSAHGAAHIAVLTRSYDNERTGANLSESILTTSNVSVSQFGKLFSRTVDGQIYAQPLYVPDLAISGLGVHNVVFVATQHNSVYAFDADDPAAATPLWHVNFGPSAPVPNNDFGNRYGPYRDIQKEVGITSTPVIDRSTNTLYIVPFIKLGPGSYTHRLYALDIETGAIKLGGPVTIQGSVPGNGVGSVAGSISFDSKQHLQRAGLALSNGVIYIAFASYGDTDPYHGWVFAYDAATLQRIALYNDTPGGEEGGIWQAGQAPAIDSSGDVYLITGNGTSSPDTGSNLGTAFVKLRLSNASLSVVDWFMPYNYDTLNQWDWDIGASGALLLPGTNLVLGGGKEGVFYVLDRGNMGHFHAGSDSQIVQSFQATSTVGYHIHGSPVYWNGPSGQLIYIWGEKDNLRAYAFNTGTGRFNPTPASQGAYTLPDGMPGGILSLSANGSAAGSGILWATHPVGDANPSTKPGVLRAYNASDLTQELWNSTQNPTRDDVGNFAKFNPPMVADGRVFVASFSDNANTKPDTLNVYGLLKPAVVAQPEDQVIVTGQTATLRVIATGQGPLSYQWYQGSSGDTSTPIVGATSSVYTTTLPATEATYWVRVGNISGSADSVTARVLVNKATTTTQLTASAGTVPAGRNVTLTARVSVVAPGAGTPTGSVTFKDGGTIIGVAPLNSSGRAVLNIATLSVADHLISAEYGGNDHFTISTSAGLTLRVTNYIVALPLVIR
jgi:hypothetical protein